jgi:hypothetical protein
MYMLLIMLITAVFSLDAVAQSGRFASQDILYSNSDNNKVQADAVQRQVSKALRLAKYFRNSSSHSKFFNDDARISEVRYQINMSMGDPAFEDVSRQTVDWGAIGISGILLQNGSESDGWINTLRYNYEYEESLLSRYEQDIWIGEDNWFNNYYEDYTYTTIDGNRYISEIITFDEGEMLRFVVSYDGTDLNQVDEYVMAGDDWELEARSEFDYDGTDFTETYLVMEGGSLENDYRMIFHNTSPSDYYGLITKEEFLIQLYSASLFYLQSDLPGMTEQYWDGSGWVNDFRTLRTEEVNPTEDVARLLNFTSSYYEGSWIPETLVSISFNDRDEVMQALQSDYDEFIEDWYVDFREVYEYDTVGNPEVITASSLDETNDVFVPVFRLLMTFDTTVDVDEETLSVPNAFTLGNAYPNPFNPTTNVPFELNRSGHVTLQAFDMLGRQVATLINEPLAAGTHTVAFDAGNLASGIYMLRLQSGNQVQTSRVALIK